MDKENNIDYARSHLRAGVNIYSGRTLALRSEKERTLNDVQKIRSGGLQTKIKKCVPQGNEL